jgi:hypothetical protein
MAFSRWFGRHDDEGLARVLEPVTFPDWPPPYADDAFGVPVLVLSYFPVIDGSIDRRATGDVSGPLDSIRNHTQETTRRLVECLELGSIYHGYKAPGASASLHYEVVGSIEYLEPLPTTTKPGHAVPMTDYRAIVERADISRWVRENGVKEVWLWGYHGGVLDLWESNMAGPFGDISNSDRDPNDLPVFEHTYTLYHYNYGRGLSEAVEDHMHQIEAVLRDADSRLFWDKFVGKVRGGRCGWAHFPPNATRDYDWANTAFVPTDIEDWQPDGGPRQLLNCNRWRGDSLTWFIYWMQNIPGRDHALSDGGRALTNWWTFIGDWDGAHRAKLGLKA